MAEVPWLALIAILQRWVQYLDVERTDPWGAEMDHPPLGRSYLVVVPLYDISCALILSTGFFGEVPWLVLISILHRWVQ